MSILDLVLAVLAALHSHASTPPPQTPPQTPTQATQGLPDGWLTINPADDVPWGVTPAQQAAAIAPDGTIHHADGTVTCVTASPCAYAAAGQAPLEPSTLDVDPIWNRPELATGPRLDPSAEADR